MCCITDSHCLTLEIWQTPRASHFPPGEGTNDTYLPPRAHTVHADNCSLLQDESCLTRTKNSCSPPSLGPASSFICTYTSQRKASLQTEQSAFSFGNSLPELLKQSCHIAVESSSGLGPCLELLSHCWHSTRVSFTTVLDAMLWSSITLDLSYLGNALVFQQRSRSDRYHFNTKVLVRKESA